MSDARNDKQLETALARLPRGSGLIFRHYHLDGKARRARYAVLQRACKRLGHIMILSGSAHQARAWRAEGVYGSPEELTRCRPVAPIAGRAFLTLATAHDAREVRKANQSGADILLISPVFATRSHPGGAVLGLKRFAALSRLSRLPVIALGGMDRDKWKTVRHAAYGWAAIDGLSR